MSKEDKIKIFNQNRKKEASQILETAKNTGEYFNIFIKPPIITTPKDIVLEDSGIRIKSKFGDAVIPYVLISELNSFNKIKKE